MQLSSILPRLFFLEVLCAMERRHCGKMMRNSLQRAYKLEMKSGDSQVRATHRLWGQHLPFLNGSRQED